jgi:hypothetical protein
MTETMNSLVTNEESKYSDFENLRKTLEALDKDYTKVKSAKPSLSTNVHASNPLAVKDSNGQLCVNPNAQALICRKSNNLGLLLDLKPKLTSTGMHLRNPQNRSMFNRTNDLIAYCKTNLDSNYF